MLQYRHSSISWAHSARLIVEAHARAHSLMIRNDIHSNFIARGACTSIYTYRKPPTFSTLFFSLTRTATLQTCLPGSRRSWRDERARQVARLVSWSAGLASGVPNAGSGGRGRRWKTVPVTVVLPDCSAYFMELREDCRGFDCLAKVHWARLCSISLLCFVAS